MNLFLFNWYGLRLRFVRGAHLELLQIDLCASINHCRHQCVNCMKIGRSAKFQIVVESNCTVVGIVCNESRSASGCPENYRTYIKSLPAQRLLTSYRSVALKIVSLSLWGNWQTKCGGMHCVLCVCVSATLCPWPNSPYLLLLFIRYVCVCVFASFFPSSQTTNLYVYDSTSFCSAPAPHKHTCIDL